MTKKPGRPKATNDKVVSILVSSFQNGLTVSQSCFQSGISREAYYQRLRNDTEFADIMTRAQQEPSLMAKANIVKAVKSGDISTSKWWLERKEKSEFSNSITVIDDEPNTDKDEIDIKELITNAEIMFAAEYQIRMTAKIKNEAIINGTKEDSAALTLLYSKSVTELYEEAMIAASKGGVKLPTWPD